MPDLKFNGEIIPVTHLLPDDVLVFTLPERIPPDAMSRAETRLRELFPLPRKAVLMVDGVSFEIHRDGKPIPVGETCGPD